MGPQALSCQFCLAGRDNDLTEEESKSVAITSVRAYREHLREYSKMSPLEVWYTRLDMQDIIAMAPDEGAKKEREPMAKKARQRVIEYLFPKITSQVGGRYRFVDQPPILFHIPEEDFQNRVQAALEDYRDSLSEERRVLLDRYRLEDIAIKVVGIGSVGTRCYITLLFSEENHPLILQVKEANRSVLEPYTRPCHHDNQGQRVVRGQRLMQSSSDIFLGWTKGRDGKHFYVRQLRDMKFSVPVEGVSSAQLHHYAEFCGWTLARAHAKSGDSATISGYLGKGDKFDEAMRAFALAYADQNEEDYNVLVQALKAGRVEALIEADL